MSSAVGRYPTWLLLVAAVALAVAAVGRFMSLDRRSNPRRVWFMLLAAWLAVIGLAGAGVFTTRTGQRITPNEGLLVCADLMAAMLVLSIPAGRATRRLTVEELRQLRPGDALRSLFGWKRALAVTALMLGTMAALLAGEIAVATELPPPPAVAACQDFTTWVLAPGNSDMPPRADHELLTQATRVAPPGPLRQHLQTLTAAVLSAISDNGQAPGDQNSVFAAEDAVILDCKPLSAAR